jgi:four helix bundle protein
VEKNSEGQKSKVENFEDLNVYQQARELTNKIYEITRKSLFCKDYGLVDQIRRASVSIMANIAEGFERGTNTEFVQFLSIAKGSCGEVWAPLSIAFDQKYIETETCRKLSDQCRLISGMLANSLTFLKGTRYRGTKDKNP